MSKMNAPYTLNCKGKSIFDNEETGLYQYGEKVPIHLKVTLTIKEAAEYSNIGINKIDSMIRMPNCPFVLYVATKKIVKLRVFLDENGKTNLSLADVNGSILSVSQFTIYADLHKGNRPSYVTCLKGELASPLYDYFNSCLKKLNVETKTGVFGADMKVNLVNDGPYTLVLDSDELGF